MARTKRHNSYKNEKDYAEEESKRVIKKRYNYDEEDYYIEDEDIEELEVSIPLSKLHKYTRK